GVDIADIGAIAVRLGCPPRAGLHAGVGPDEIPVGELELIVRKARDRLDLGIVEAVEMVWACLEDKHAEALCAEHVGDRAAARAAADDDRVEAREAGVADDGGAHGNTWPPAARVMVWMKSIVSASSGAGSGPSAGVDIGASGRSR